MEELVLVKKGVEHARKDLLALHVGRLAPGGEVLDDRLDGDAVDVVVHPAVDAVDLALGLLGEPDDLKAVLGVGSGNEVEQSRVELQGSKAKVVKRCLLGVRESALEEGSKERSDDGGREGDRDGVGVGLLSNELA